MLGELCFEVLQEKTTHHELWVEMLWRGVGSSAEGGG